MLREIVLGRSAVGGVGDEQHRSSRVQFSDTTCSGLHRSPTTTRGKKQEESIYSHLSPKRCLGAQTSLCTRSAFLCPRSVIHTPQTANHKCHRREISRPKS